MIKITIEDYEKIYLETWLVKLGEQFTLLTLCPILNIQDVINETLKFLTKTDSSGIYVTFSKPYETLARILRKEKIKNIKDILFIDCISQSSFGPTREGNVLYLSNTGDLNRLINSISDFVRTTEGKKFLLIDALETLLIYQRADEIAMFTKAIIAKSSKYKLKTVIFTPGGNEELIDKIAIFFDKEIRMR